MNTGGKSLGIRVRQNRGLFIQENHRRPQSTQKALWVATGSCPPAAHCSGSTSPVPREGSVWRFPVHCGGQRLEEIGYPACRGDNSLLVPKLGLLSRHSLLHEGKQLRTDGEAGCPQLLHPVLRITAKDAPVGPELPKMGACFKKSVVLGGFGGVI